ncbi:peroxisomal targeting signal 2 receptor [Salpingoeca rosetta]|uniref:Peroxin-7 n=1 Tax=Salpingoeca rosetta (strain ATCC 50818 / BSB-021) TaxID=946362 RepID=F2U7L9_SALR5|nr:peroxisomal targeting signal 2 receptor [Salpingoeca rosetta]EGD83436.1 peroxisomal targeting signal 2 receptor [Salpingoeca rosetta]|eukprot:XP_004994940.1 peroxisomal targeting signal 2 receptor [Salpingoeca rosetta]
MVCLRVDGVHPYAIAFSPYTGDRLAVASAQHFGIAGKGSVSVFDRSQDWATIAQAEWKDGLFSAAWAETNENQLLTCSGDGTCQLWDIADMSKPLHVFAEHTKEATRVSHCQAREGALFASSSWDQSVKVWDATGASGHSLATLSHQGFVYDVRWSPHRQHTIASACEDGTVSVWDTRAPRPAQVVQAHAHEALCLDWNKYDANMLVSGSVDRTVRCFDLRMAPSAVPLYVLEAHQLAVRTVACSPFDVDVIATGSYDMCAFLWNVRALRTAMGQHGDTSTRQQPPSSSSSSSSSAAATITTPSSQVQAKPTTAEAATVLPSSVPLQQRVLGRQADALLPRPRLLSKHTEFVTGVDFNVFAPEVAHCSWDSTICVHPV